MMVWFGKRSGVVALGAWGLLVVAPAMAQMPATKVVVAEARAVQIEAPITLVGTVAPARRSQVASEVAGVVSDMPARQGDRLDRGQLICSLNSDITRLRLAEAMARLAALKDVHRELLAGTREEDLRRLEALAREAEARMTRWTFEKDRVEKLYEGKDAGSTREVYDARAEYDMAVQRHLAARAEYEMAQRGPRAETIAKAADDVAEQQAVVDRLKCELDKRSIAAPFAGSVAQRVVEVGEWVREGGAVVELVDLSSVLVRVDVPEASFAFVQVGDAAAVRVEALGTTLDGAVKHVLPLGHEQARTFPVEIEIPNGDGRLAAGMFARVTVAGGPRREAVAVPKDAIVQRDGVDYVTVIVPGPDKVQDKQGGEPGSHAAGDDGGHAGAAAPSAMGVPTPVTTGLSINDWITITSGNLSAGAKVVSRGNERIVFPSPVEAVDLNGVPVKLDFSAPATSAKPDSPSPKHNESGEPRRPQERPKQP